LIKNIGDNANIIKLRKYEKIPAVVILEQGVFSLDSSLRSRMTTRKNTAAKDLGVELLLT
jgi:hypothetical protein